MIRHLLLLLLLSLLAVQPLVAQQQVLVISRVDNGKEKIIKQGTIIKAADREGNWYKGRFAILQDSLLVIEGKGVPLSQIVEIRKATLGIKILGGALSTLAGVSTIFGGYAIVRLLAEGGLGVLLAAILVVPVTITALLTGAGFLIMNWGKRYKMPKWEFRIDSLPALNPVQESGR